MLNYEGLSIGVDTQRDDDTAWLEEMLLPWFTPAEGTPDVSVSLKCDGARFRRLQAAGSSRGIRRVFMLDTRTLDLPCWSVPGHDIALHDAGQQLFYLVRGQQIELVAAREHTDYRISLMRVVRELAMGVAQLAGHRFLHASAFSLKGRAAIISGPREAGKTSLLTYALSHLPVDYLTNDRLLVKTSGATTVAAGMPTIVSIRDGTMDLFPGMLEGITARGYRSRATLAETREPEKLAGIPAKQDGVSLTPRQLCTLLQCAPVARAQAAALLFPRQTGRPGGLELQRLDTDSARERLRHGLFGHIGPNRLSEVFTVFPPGLGRRRAADDSTLCHQLAASVPAWECLLGKDSYRDARGAEDLRALLENTDSVEAGK